MTQTVKLIGTTCILIVLSRMQLVVCTQMRCQNQINMLMLNYLYFLVGRVVIYKELLRLKLMKNQICYVKKVC